MARTLPEPGYYRSGDKDVLVVDPAKLADTGEIVTKDGDDARWSPAVAFRMAYQAGSPLYVLSADVFDGRFKPTTQEDALKRVQERERAESFASAEGAREADGDGETIPGSA
jgi:hypothetical protein